MTNVTSLMSEALPKKWIAYLFDQMAMMFGKKFTDQWGQTDPEKLQNFWAEQLAGYSRAELSRGFNAMQAKDWPPTLPEFKRMCRPPVDPLVAYYEAVAGVTERERGNIGEWSHPAIFWAAAAMSYDLRQLTYTAIKTRWEKALAEQMEKGEWAEIPKPLIALPAPGKGRADREQAEKMMAQYRCQLTPKNKNERAWIGKILERAKRKDETLPAISLRFAQEALQIK